MAAPNEQDFAGDFGITELSTTVWWLQQIQNPQNWAPGGVFVVFCGPTSCIAPAAAWFTTANALLKQDGSALFSRIQVIAPPGHGRSNHKAAFRATFESAHAKAKQDFPAKLRQTLEDPALVFEEHSSACVLTSIEALPEGSSVGICGAQRLRFHDLQSSDAPGLQTHTGFTVRNVTDQSLTFPHIFELLRRLLTIAANRRLSIVVFVEDFAMEVANLPDRKSVV